VTADRASTIPARVKGGILLPFHEGHPEAAIDSKTFSEPDGESAALIAGAIQAEKKAAWFYRTLAGMTSDGVARTTLEGLADDEISHAEVLVEMYLEITGRREVEAVPSAAEGEPNFFEFPSTSRRAALEFALRNEIRAADLYASQAGVSEDPRRKSMFRRLAATELEHAAYLRTQLG
jgi:rubrerythrin